MNPSLTSIENLSIYLINLDRSSDRLAHAEKEFAQKQLSFERFSAIDGKTLSEEHIATIHANQKWFMPLLPNEIACYMSHMDVLRHFVSHSDNEYALICEDDIILDDDIKEGLEAMVTNWPDNCHMIKCFAGIVMTGKPVATIESRHLDIEIIDPIKVTTGGFCHLVSKEGAQKFIANMPFKRPFDFDHQFVWEHGCNIFQTNSLKNDIDDEAIHSDIGGRGHKPFLPHMRYKVDFYIRNFSHNIKRWGFIKTIQLLALYRIERLKNKWQDKLESDADSLLE